MSTNGVPTKVTIHSIVVMFCNEPSNQVLNFSLLEKDFTAKIIANVIKEFLNFDSFAKLFSIRLQ